MAIRVIIKSSRTLVRAGLVAILHGQPHIQVIGEIDDATRRTNLDCDVLLWDVGVTVPERLASRFLVLLSAPHIAQPWLAAGAAGCVLETASVEELLSAIRQVARGDTYLSPPIVQELVSSTVLQRQQLTEVEPLTEREREVFNLLAQGLSNKDIAQKLYLSVRTVEGHLANIYGKLHLKSRTEAVLWAAHNL